MKNVLIHLFALAGCAVAAPSSAPTHDIDLPGIGTAIVGAREALERRTLNPTYCYHDNSLRDLLNTKVAASASVYCSGYLQQTSTVTQTFTAYTSTSTSLTTSTTTTDTSTTATITAPTTSVTSMLECGVSGYGTGAYDFDVNESFGGTVNDCQAHCACENAVSFGYGSNTCACYNQYGDFCPSALLSTDTDVHFPQYKPTYSNSQVRAIVPATETDTITLTSTVPGPTTTIFV